MGSDEKKSKKEKREARSPEDAAAREARKAAKRAKKEGEKKGGGVLGRPRLALLLLGFLLLGSHRADPPRGAARSAARAGASEHHVQK